MKSSKLLKCQTCTYKQETNHYSTDGFDRMVDWVCSVKDNQLIQGAVEWHEESKIQTPDWCPIIQEIRKEIETVNIHVFLCEGI